MDLLERAKQKLAEQKAEKKTEVKITPEIKKIPKQLPEKPKKRSKITGDKDLNKDEMCNWIANYINENKDVFTLDWLRGQKLTFESVIEMRKIKR